MLSTQLIIPNYLVILSHQRSTIVSLETYPLKLVLDIDWSNRKKAANEINMVIMSICQTRKVSDAFLSEDFQNSTTTNAMEKNNNRIFHSWAYTICSEMATWLSEAICFTENYKFKFVNYYELIYDFKTTYRFLLCQFESQTFIFLP